MTTQIQGNLLDIKFVLEKSGIKEGSKVADLGCGNGYFVFPASDFVGSKGKIYAVDILKTTLANINKKIEQENKNNIETVWSDLEIFKATNIETSSLDLALLVNTLHQVNERANVIREATRLLKKNGKLLVVEWKEVHIPFGPPLKNRVGKKSLKQGAQRLGLHVEEEFEAGDYHYGLIFIKL